MDATTPQAPLAASLEAAAYASLRDALIEGAFAPGARLSLRLVAAALGVSAMPVRAALRRLAAEQAVEVGAQGSFVVPRLTRPAYRELVELRLLLEPLAAAKAAARLDRAGVAALGRLAAQAKAARHDGDWEAYRAADHKLHRDLYRAAQAPLLLATIEAFWIRRAAVFSLARALLSARAKDDHAGIMAGLRARAPDQVAQAVADEIADASSFLLAHLAFAGDAPAPPGVAGLAALRR
jgi:GntR family transcriptional regulator, colanic acid and biofilm gene transcriptional regulator